MCGSRGQRLGFASRCKGSGRVLARWSEVAMPVMRMREGHDLVYRFPICVAREKEESGNELACLSRGASDTDAEKLQI